MTDEDRVTMSNWAASERLKYQDPLLTVDTEGKFRCPWCFDEWVHVESIMYTGGMEGSGLLDQRPTSVLVKGAHGEDAVLPIEVSVIKTPNGVRVGRRHTISFSVWCESCSRRGWVHLTQHKGNTYTTFTVRGNRE
jgi:hypothetical protein